MKKKVYIILCAVFLALTLVGCGSHVTGVGKEKSPVAIENAEEKIDANLRYFLGITDYAGNEKSEYGDMGNRTPTSEAEQHAAKKLYNHYIGKEENPDYDPDSMPEDEEWLSVTSYEHIDVTELGKTEFTLSIDGETRKSYNVEIRYTGGAEHEKQVVIGTGYDAAYGKVTDAYSGQQSTGATENGTGVAALMTLIDWCEETAPEFGFDLVFVFFGCSAYSGAGASAYVEAMEPTQKLNTLLMVNLHRFGGDRTYLYADEVKTAHETFLRNTADENGLSVYTLPSNVPIIDGVYRQGIDYAHYGMLGNHAAFLDAHIPSVYLFDGYYGGFNLSDLEKRGKSNLGGTKDDTYPSLIERSPSYKTHAADTLTLLVKAFGSDGFVAAVTTARKNEKDMSFWTNSFWAYMIVIFTIVALIVVLIVLVKYFEKKHPLVPTVRKLKVAVFGMDYEDKTSADIFIDVKSRPDPFGDGGDNPFDGY